MTTEWLSGLLAIASVIMLGWLFPLIRLEARSSDTPLTQNRALRLSAGLVIHALGAITMFFVFRGVGHDLEAMLPPVMLWMLWAGLGLWLVAKTLWLTTSKLLRISMALYAVWSLSYVLQVWR